MSQLSEDALTPPLQAYSNTGDIVLSPSTVETSAIRKVCFRLVPFIALMFFINFLDRTAISFAGPNGLTRDLGLTAAQFGFAAGIFFVGYILLEIPSNLALHRFGARRWMARIMVTWGIVALLFTWVESVTGLYWLRFLLGVAEAGFFPGAILYLSLWVPQQHRSKVLSLFYLAQPLTIVIGAPVAALLMQQQGLFDLAGWRIMFFGVAIPAIVIGVAAWFFLTDKPEDAKWLTSAEKQWLVTELAKEDRAKADPHHRQAGKALLNGRVWVLALVYFGLVYGLYALAFFLPTIIGGFEAQFGTKFDVFQKGLVTAIPYLPAAVALYLWSRDAGRRGVRTWHIALPAVVGAISVPLALFMKSPVATVAAITVTACAIFAALPNFWAIPARFLSGAGAAAGIALINTVGNGAGFAAPFLTGALKDATGSYQVPMFVVGGFMLLSAALVCWLEARSRPGAEAARAATLGGRPSFK
jgi:MFS family permease